MENFEYYNPVKVIFGAGRVNEIGSEVAAHGKKAMLVSYTEHDFFNTVIEKIHASLAASGVECVDFFGVQANPRLSACAEAVEICKKEGIEVVIGLGGGSAMDSAKVIAAGVPYPYEIEKMIYFSHSDDSEIPPEEALPTVMIPTLPATGSEMNPTAVVTDDVNHRKSYVWHPCLYPKAAVMDPELVCTLPPYQTACGAFDIIAHVIEAYLNGAEGYNFTVQNRMAEGVVKSVLDNLPVVRDNPNDVQARGALMWAASIGLNGWLTSGTFGFTPMHQMGHVLSARYDATHGATLACMMPAWMRYFATREDNDAYVRLAYRIFDKDLLSAADDFESLMKGYGVQTRISEWGVTEDDIESLTDGVVDVSFGPDGKLNGHPKMSRDDIAAIYRLAL